MDTPAGITADDVRTMQGLAQKVTALRPDLLGGEATYGELAWSWGQAVSLIGDAWRRRLVYDGDELIALTTRRVVLSGDAPFFLLRPMPMPSRPRRFACLQGKALRAIPAARCLAPLDAAEPAAPDRPGQRPAVMDEALANTPGLTAAGCANACRPQRWRFLPVTSRRTVHGQPARHRYGASTPRLNTCAARCSRSVLACRWVADLARVRGRAGEAFGQGCRAGHISFRSGSAQGVLVSL